MRLIRFAVVLAVSLVLAPLAAEGQPARKTARIGILIEGPAPSPEELAKLIPTNPFWQAMKDLGWVHGQNIVAERRFAQSPDQLPAFAAELVGLNVDVIVAYGTPAAKAAKQATSTIPIVITSGVEDPVALGLVASLARPGGNVTGSIFGGYEELLGKRLDLLKEVIPRLARVANLFNPTNPSHTIVYPERDAVLKAAGVQLQRVAVSEAKALDHALAEISKGKPDALIIAMDVITLVHAKPIADFAVRSHLPTMALAREFVDAGALMSYGPSRSAQLRQAASYVDKILKGRKPADLPIERQTTFELVINMKTAKALGLTIPPSVLGRADQIIE